MDELVPDLLAAAVGGISGLDSGPEGADGVRKDSANHEEEDSGKDIQVGHRCQPVANRQAVDVQVVEVDVGVAGELLSHDAFELLVKLLDEFLQLGRDREPEHL